MRSQAASPTALTQSGAVKEMPYVQLWEAWLEPVAGICIVIGLCWAYIVPSLLPVNWWMFLPVAMFGGFIRQRKGQETRAALLPLWLFFCVFVLFVLYAAALHPLNDYGREKTMHFALLATMAYLAASRQPPLTAEFLRGIRWGLGATLALSLLLVWLKRDFFLDQQTLGVEALKSSVSMAILPLIIAVSMTIFIPRTVKPVAVLTGGVFLLLGALLEVFARGRFHMFVLGGLACLLVLGPPWKHIFSRVMICGILLVIALTVYVNIIPLLGDSFLYLTWLDPQSLAGRSPMWQLALEGFWRHPLGQGIGSFPTTSLYANYPHNVLLEVAFEMGILGVACMLAIYLSMLRRVAQLWLSPPHRLLAAMTALVFLHMLKSGDIATLAFQWVFLYLLVVNTPMAKSWPLQRGEEVA